jgi:hypothetical protein
MVRMAYTPNPVTSRSKEAPGSLNAMTKVPRAFPLQPNTGADCTEWSPQPRYRRRQPASKRVSVATSGQTIIRSSHIAWSAGSNIGRCNRAVRERAEGRIWQAGKHYPFECSPSDVDDSAARDGPGLKLFSHPAQCANQFFPARICVVQI